jgi:NADH-quinone oxidoreductase subunit A
MPPVGDARERHPVKFYLVAMIFCCSTSRSRSSIRLPWPSASWAGSATRSWSPFFAILLVGYVYVWRKGVLDWGRERVSH